MDINFLNFLLNIKNLNYVYHTILLVFFIFCIKYFLNSEMLYKIAIFYAMRQRISPLSGLFTILALGLYLKKITPLFMFRQTLIIRWIQQVRKQKQYFFVKLLLILLYKTYLTNIFLFQYKKKYISLENIKVGDTICFENSIKGQIKWHHKTGFIISQDYHYSLLSLFNFTKHKKYYKSKVVKIWLEKEDLIFESPLIHRLAPSNLIYAINPKLIKTKEQRRYTRYTPKSPISISIAQTQKLVGYDEYPILNFSEKGIAFTSSKEFCLNDIVWIKHKSFLSPIKSRIASYRINDRDYIYGLEIKKVKPISNLGFYSLLFDTASSQE